MTGALGVTANRSPGVTTITVDGVETSTQKLSVGEFIRFAGHTKVYMVASSSLAGGINTINIQPKLQGNIVVGEEVFYGPKVSMLSLFSPDTRLGVSYQDGVLAEVMSVKIIEKL
jgi:hypothetical protein